MWRGPSRDSVFPTGLPSHATKRPLDGRAWHTHWHSLGIHSNQVHTRYSSVLCSWVYRHTGRWDCKCCWPHPHRHRCSLQGQGQWLFMIFFYAFPSPLNGDVILSSMWLVYVTARLTLAVWEVVISWLAAVATLPVYTLAAEAAPWSVTHLPHCPSVVAHTLCGQTWQFFIIICQLLNTTMDREIIKVVTKKQETEKSITEFLSLRQQRNIKKNLFKGCWWNSISVC